MEANTHGLQTEPARELTQEDLQNVSRGVSPCDSGGQLTPQRLAELRTEEKLLTEERQASGGIVVAKLELLKEQGARGRGQRFRPLRSPELRPSFLDHPWERGTSQRENGPKTRNRRRKPKTGQRLGRGAICRTRGQSIRGAVLRSSMAGRHGLDAAQVVRGAVWPRPWPLHDH